MTNRMGFLEDTFSTYFLARIFLMVFSDLCLVYSFLIGLSPCFGEVGPQRPPIRNMWH